MSNIDEKLSKLIQIKSDIKDAIVDKGVVMPAGLPFDQYSTKIGEISSGGGSGVTVTVSTDDAIEVQAAKIPTSVTALPLKELQNAEMVGTSIKLDPSTNIISGFNADSRNNYLQVRNLNLTGQYDIYLRRPTSYSNYYSNYYFDMYNESDGELLGESLIRVNFYPDNNDHFTLYLTKVSDDAVNLDYGDFYTNKNEYYKMSIDTSNKTISMYKSADGISYELAATKTYYYDLPPKITSIRFGTRATASSWGRYVGNLYAGDFRIEQDGQIIYKLMDYPSENDDEWTETDNNDWANSEDDF